MGTLRLDPNESLALSDSRHPITEVGIGKIIDRAQHDAVKQDIKSQFEQEELLDSRPAYRVKIVSSGTDGVGGSVAASEVVIWIDRELKLPVKLELYDAAHVLLERHRFKDVRVNQRLSDKLFEL